MRISKLADYGVILLTHIATSPEDEPRNARDIAIGAKLPPPTVSKILKALARQGLLLSHRGTKGGYTLARRPEEISVAEIIGALEGPIAVTECNVHLPGECDRETLCPVRSNWQIINRAVAEALHRITLSQMMQPKFGFERLGDRASMVRLTEEN